MNKTIEISAEHICKELAKRQMLRVKRLRRVRKLIPEDYCGTYKIGRLKTRYRFRRYKPFKRVVSSGTMRKARRILPQTFRGAWKRTANMGNRRLIRESLATPARLFYRHRFNPFLWGAAGVIGYKAYARNHKRSEEYESGLKNANERIQPGSGKENEQKMVTVMIRGKPVQITEQRYRDSMNVGFQPGLGRYGNRD